MPFGVLAESSSMLTNFNAGFKGYLGFMSVVLETVMENPMLAIFFAAGFFGVVAGGIRIVKHL